MHSDCPVVGHCLWASNHEDGIEVSPEPVDYGKARPDGFLSWLRSVVLRELLTVYVVVPLLFSFKPPFRPGCRRWPDRR